MRYTLQNEYIAISVDSLGAELKSLKKNNREYLWGADPKFWDRTSPILFPMIGRLKNGEFTTGGRAYHMNLHGFACDMEFKAVEITNNSLTMQLTSSARTLSLWPFEFVLEVSYVINGSTLSVNWNVRNTGDKDLYFSIGGHPGFLCPDGHYCAAYVEDSAGSGALVPATEEPITWVTDQGLLSHSTETVSFEEGRLPITRNLFRQGNGTLVFTDTAIKRLALADKDLHEYVTVDFDTPVLALWSPDLPDTPFVCIEPWCGVCDYEDADGIWEHRPFSNRVACGEVFEQRYTITL